MNFPVAVLVRLVLNFCCVAASVAGNAKRFSSNAKKRKKNLVSTQNYFQRLEETLHARKKSKGALAQHLGIALSTVSRWRTAVPIAETVQATADFLDVDAKWLLTGQSSDLHHPETAQSAGKVKDHSGPDKENQGVVKDYTELLTRIADALEALVKQGELK